MMKGHNSSIVKTYSIINQTQVIVNNNNFQSNRALLINMLKFILGLGLGASNIKEETP